MSSNCPVKQTLSEVQFVSVSHDFSQSVTFFPVSGCVYLSWVFLIAVFSTQLAAPSGSSSPRSLTFSPIANFSSETQRSVFHHTYYLCPIFAENWKYFYFSFQNHSFTWSRESPNQISSTLNKSIRFGSVNEDGIQLETEMWHSLEIRVRIWQQFRWWQVGENPSNPTPVQKLTKNH